MGRGHGLGYPGWGGVPCLGQEFLDLIFDLIIQKLATKRPSFPKHAKTFLHSHDAYTLS